VRSRAAPRSGLPPEELLDFYHQAQDPVVTLSARPIARDNARVLELRRHPDINTMLTAVWWAASPKVTGHPVVRGAWS
jgi:hypothetical protein